MCHGKGVVIFKKVKSRTIKLINDSAVLNAVRIFLGMSVMTNFVFFVSLLPDAG